MAKVDPRVAPEMNKNGHRHAVMAAYPNELTTDIPEHAFLGEYYNERARGLGATMDEPTGSSAEENILCLADDRYNGEDITILQLQFHIKHFQRFLMLDLLYY